VVLQARHALQVAEVGGVSLPIALGLWWMMFPVLCKVRHNRHLQALPVGNMAM
jgi:ACR3 family arsenite transporter